ncbi:MAG: RcnB family protein [Brevundimonas sp.]|uniref:RcnB family protein n=1 Tax=Brevundimonas sp. TaxID=1871086 RepID=UPI0039195FB1
MKTLAKAAAIAIGLITVSAPLAAEAQSRRDGREWRQDRRDDRRDYRRDNRQDQREWRQDRRNSRPPARPPAGRHSPPPRVDRWDRGNPNWWRGRPEFRSYSGPRRGYYFAPSYGYYRVEPRYYGYRWQRGHTLPSAYRSYHVRDPYFYGLRPAPRGYRWVHANNDIVLIALASGLIADIVLNVY